MVETCGIIPVFSTYNLDELLGCCLRAQYILILFEKHLKSERTVLSLLSSSFFLSFILSLAVSTPPSHLSLSPLSCLLPQALVIFPNFLKM